MKKMRWILLIITALSALGSVFGFFGNLKFKMQKTARTSGKITKVSRDTKSSVAIQFTYRIGDVDYEAVSKKYGYKRSGYEDQEVEVLYLEKDPSKGIIASLLSQNLVMSIIASLITLTLLFFIVSIFFLGIIG